MNPATNASMSCRNVVIIDPAFDEYAHLCDEFCDEHLCVTFTNSGSGALRLVPSHCDAEWLVNAELPDMTGLELLEMLRAIEPCLSVQLVANQYDVEHELKAYRMGAKLYATKPHDRRWFDDR